jgi:hypothetical protein
MAERKTCDEVRTEWANAMATLIVALTTSPSFARKASHHHSKRGAPNHQLATKLDPGGVERHLDDVALDRKTGSICRGVLGGHGKGAP